MPHVLTAAPLVGSLPFLDSISNIALVVLGVGFLILVHELGHFLVAKWADVEVQAFSIGFGPALLRWRRGETEYRISVIPLGGYVKMAGEGLPVEGEEAPPRELRAKSAPVRAAIFSAGVVMNALSAVLLFMLVFAVGVSLTSPVIGAVEPGTPAWEAGLEPGDRILDIDGNRPIDFEDLFQDFAYAGEDRDLRVRYRRGETVGEVTLRPRQDPRLHVPTVGISPRPLPASPVLVVRPDGPAAQAGLRTGDRLVAVNGQRSGNVNYLARCLDGAEVLRLTVERDGQTIDAEVRGERSPTETKLLGIQPWDGEVLAVQPASAAQAFGFRAGDRFLRVGDRPATTLRALARALRSLPLPDAAVAVTVEREGREETLRGSIADLDERERLLDGLDAGDVDSTRFAYVDDALLEFNPVARADPPIPEGATITAVNGHDVSDWRGVQEAIQESGDGPVRLTWRVGDGPAATSGDLEKQPARDLDRGFSLKVAKETVRVSLGRALVIGFQRSVLMGKRVIQMIAGIFGGSISGKNLGGPILIFSAARMTVEQSFMEFLLFLGLLSMNLAIINLLPIPILDGGHLLFLLIEKVKGSPVSERTFAFAQWLGLVLILALLVYVTFNDIMRLL